MPPVPNQRDKIPPTGSEEDRMMTDEDISEPEVPLLEHDKTINSNSSYGTTRLGVNENNNHDDDDGKTQIINKSSPIFASTTLHQISPNDEKHFQINLPSPVESNSSSQFFKSGTVWRQV